MAIIPDNWERMGFELRDGSYIHPLAFINWDYVTIGPGSIIYPFAIIGAPGETSDDRERGGVWIGSQCEIRSHVTIDCATKKDSHTEIGRNSLLMSKSHVGHDCVFGEGVTISTGAKIGGHCVIGRGANIGLNAVVHQRTKVGAFAMVGMQSAVTKNVPRGRKVYGVPAKIHGLNEIGIRRANLPLEDFE